MEPKDPPPRKADEPEEVLRRLEERLGRASEAAERLMSEAAHAAGSQRSSTGENPEPGGEGGNAEPGGEGRNSERGGEGGNAEPGGEGGNSERGGERGNPEPRDEGVPEGEQLRPPPSGWQAPQEHRREPDLLIQAFQSLRELLPPELQQRLVEALREVLLALRALLDWYLERLERRRAEPTEVEDIPIR
jgi:hypothetical protein